VKNRLLEPAGNAAAARVARQQSNPRGIK